MISPHEPEIQFLSVCHYITSFSIIFNNTGLIDNEVQNQSVPVLNALFKNLKKSENKTEAKIHLLLQMIYTPKVRHVDETYKHIINTARFHHYGSIINYLTWIINNNTNLALIKDNVIKHLLESHVIQDPCSSGTGHAKLPVFTVSKMLADYVWSNFIEARNVKRNTTYPKKHEALERSKRQTGRYVIDDSRLPFKKRRTHFAADNMENIVSVPSSNVDDSGNNATSSLDNENVDGREFSQDDNRINQLQEFSTTGRAKYQSIFSPISSWDDESDIEDIVHVPETGETVQAGNRYTVLEGTLGASEIENMDYIPQVNK